MATITINDVEDDALQGLPWDAQLIYLRFLRRRMDFMTGEVGRRHRISWQSVLEVLDVAKLQGCDDTGKPSRDRAKRAAKHLERAGLVVMRSIKEDRHLIFFLPMADTDKSAQKKPARNPPDEPARSESSSGAAFGIGGRPLENEKPAQHPGSVKNIRNGYSSGTSSAQAREEHIHEPVSDQFAEVIPLQQKASAGKVPDQQASPHVQIAVFLRSHDVDILPMNPLLSEWISTLRVTGQEYLTAIQMSRRQIPPDTLIPYRYLDKVIRSQRNPSPQRQSKLDQRRATYEGLTGKKGGSNVIDITAYSTHGN